MSNLPSAPLPYAGIGAVVYEDTHILPSGKGMKYRRRIEADIPAFSIRSHDEALEKIGRLAPEGLDVKSVMVHLFDPRKENSYETQA